MQLKTRLGREPWSTKRLKELIIKRLWVWIQSPNTGCKFFTLICCKICIVYVKRPKIKENETKDVPFLKTKMLLRKHFLLFTVCLPFSIWVRQVTLKRLIINKVIFCSRAEDAVVSASKGNTFLQKKLIVAGFFVPNRCPKHNSFSPVWGGHCTTVRKQGRVREHFKGPRWSAAHL